MFYDDLLQVENLLYNVRFQKNQAVPQMKLMDFKLDIRKVPFKSLWVCVLLIFFDFDYNFFKENLHIVKKSIDHILDVSTVNLLFTRRHSLGVFVYLFVDLDFII